MAIGDKNHSNLNPLINAGWINKAFFWWLKDIVLHGRKHHISAEDIYDTVPEDLSQPLRSCLEIAWEHEIKNARAKKRKPRLWKALARAYFWSFLKFSFFSVGFTGLLIAGPSFLETAMSYFDPTTRVTQTQAFLNGTALIFFMLLRTVFFHHNCFHLNRLGLRVSIACSSLIYKKMLRLSASTSRSPGSSLINLLTVDVAKFEIVFIYVPFLFIVPVQLLATIYLIWQYVDFDATISSVTLMIFLTLPILVFYDRIFLKLRKKQAVTTDERLSLITEMINGVRAIKMYVWETYFEDCVRLARKHEVKSNLYILYAGSVIGVISTFCHRLSVFIVMFMYVSQYGFMAADKMLAVSQHFSNLQMTITMMIFPGVNRIGDTRVSVKRIEDFLLLPEVQATTYFI